ncbi:MAG: BatA and WFA domain-containing protein, partial [Longimicrobiales bacterium]|nr:BatA and WFA domain-containing protein [Longimicrobiales bacterium]
MGALSPLFLIAAVSIGVPIYLHLFHRQQTRRLPFPALRYLERTEREHARQIRFRQFLLLLFRIVALLLITGAGARLFFAGRGGAHAPTAAVIVLDNSLSSGLVMGEVRLLDEFKARAMRTLDAGAEDDRFWLIRAGEPWLPAIPGTRADTRQAVEETVVSEAGGDLSAAIDRAVRLLETSTMEHREIHLLSDLQSTSFVDTNAAPAGDIPVVVWTGHQPESSNRALSSVVVGGGLPPLEGQRASVTIEALEPTSEADTLHVPLRLVVNQRIRGAATLPPGAQTTIAVPPSGTGWVRGYADADPD